MKHLLSIFFFAALSVNAQSYRIAVQPTGSKFWGYANEKGQLIIDAKFLKYTDFSPEGYAAVMDDKKRYSFIDVNGKELVLPVSSYEIPSVMGLNMKGFSNGMANVIVNKKYGSVNTKGQWIHQPTYDKITPYNDEIAVAEKDTKFNILTDNGEVYPCPSEVMDVKDFTEGMAPYKGKNDLFGFINKQGKAVIPAKYLSVGYFSKGLAWAKTVDQTIGFIDPTGNWVISPQFEAAKEFDIETGIAMVKKNGEWKLIQKNGQFVTADGATGFGEFNEGYGYAKKGNLVGFINPKGEWVIPANFDKVERMYSGFTNVKKGDFWGVVDKSGKTIIATIYQGVNPIHDGLFAVKKGSLWGFIDRNGKIVIDFKYTGIRDFENGFAAVKVVDQWGLIDTSGKELLPAKYDRIQDMIKIMH